VRTGMGWMLHHVHRVAVFIATQLNRDSSFIRKAMNYMLTR